MSLPGLNAHDRSYMLLPNFNFFPGGQIQLGTILPAVTKGELLDPKRPQNSEFRVSVDARLMNGDQELKPFSYDSRKTNRDKATLRACISLLTGVGGHVSGERNKARELMIDCDCVQVQSFHPDKRYLAQSVDDEMIQTLSRKLKRPPLYMVTGLMVADHAIVRVSDERGWSYGAGVEGDVTSQGVPLNAGLEGEHARSGNFTLVSVPTKPFILAYQIVRLRRKGAMIHEQDENKWALLDDDDDAASDPLADWDVDWFGGGLDETEELE